VLGEGRGPESPVLVGSVKSNIGHTEGAAGVAGLIKVVLALEHETIPPQLHFNDPNPHIPWAELPVSVVTKAQAWKRSDKPRRAGVSSFGFSGTNAHVVLEEAPVRDRPASVEAPVRSAELVVLSAKSAEALAEAATRLRVHMDRHPEQALGDI